MRECGLKSFNQAASASLSLVTPLAGVWIEIAARAGYFSFRYVASPGVSVYRNSSYAVINACFFVTPLAGVWIEISKSSG